MPEAGGGLCHTLYFPNIFLFGKHKRNDAQLPPVSCCFPAASRISFVHHATESSTRSPRACSRVPANNLKRAQCTHLAAPRPSRNPKARARSRGQSCVCTVSAGVQRPPSWPRCLPTRSRYKTVTAGEYRSGGVLRRAKQVARSYNIKGRRTMTHHLA